MTVIAGFTFEDTAVLIGDILASSSASLSRYIPVPTVDDPRQTLWQKLGYSAGLFQKLAFISPYLCVAWSGEQQAAARIVDEMNHVAGSGPVPQKAFLEYMDEIPNDSQTSSPSIIALAVYEGGAAELVVRKVREIRNQPHGMKAYCGGSGWEDASDLFLRRGALREQGSPIETALGFAHKLAGIFHSRESSPGPNASMQNPLRRGAQYGAGYQVAVLRDGRIVPEAETTLQFWEGHVSKNGTLTLDPPTLFIRRDYRCTRLVLRSARIRRWWTSNTTISSSDNQFCVEVPRVDEDHSQNPDNITLVPHNQSPSFETTYEGQVIRLTVENGPAVMLSTLQRPQYLHQRTLSFSDVGGTTIVALNPPAAAGLRAFLQEQLGSPRFEEVLRELQGPLRTRPAKSEGPAKPGSRG
jgi:hypothetical protein